MLRKTCCQVIKAYRSGNRQKRELSHDKSSFLSKNKTVLLHKTYSSLKNINL